MLTRVDADAIVHNPARNVGAERRARVQTACQEIGGQLVEAGDEGVATSGGSFRFSFSFLSRQWSSAWGEPCTCCSAWVVLQKLCASMRAHGL